MQGGVYGVISVGKVNLITLDKRLLLETISKSVVLVVFYNFPMGGVKTTDTYDHLLYSCSTEEIAPLVRYRCNSGLRSCCRQRESFPPRFYSVDFSKPLTEIYR